MTRYCFKITLCSFLLSWGLVSSAFANYYYVAELRNLNPGLWDQLGLNEYFPDLNVQLQIMEGDNWSALLQELVEKLQDRVTPPDRSRGLKWVMAKLTRKPRFDPAHFPVVWLAFRSIREVLPFEFRDAKFLQQLRNFRLVDFPLPLVWPAVDLSFLSLAGAILHQHKFKKCTLNYANFSGAQLTECIFISCVIHNLIVDTAALVSTSSISKCIDEQSVESAIMLYQMQQSVAEDQERKAVLIMQQALCMKTSGQEDLARSLVLLPACESLQPLEYLRALFQLKEYELLCEAIVAPSTLKQVELSEYKENPSEVLRLAWTLYVLINRSPSQQDHQDDTDKLWNLLVVGLVGVRPPQDDSRGSGVRAFPKLNFHTVPATSLGYQVSLVEYLNTHHYQAVVIPKDDSCFYSAIAYHMPEANSVANTGSIISPGDWLRQVLALIYLQYLIQQGYSAEDLAAMIDSDVYSAVAELAKDLQGSKGAAIQANQALVSLNPTDVLHELITPNVWAPQEFGCLAAILLDQPVFEIQMHNQAFFLHQNQPDGSSVPLEEIPVTSEGNHPLLVIYSGHSHWLTALIPLTLILSQQAHGGGAD